MSYMEPPEPLCPRCKDYINEEDQKYCPHCYEELDFSDIDMENARGLLCHNCDKYVNVDDIAWRCGKCGFDSREQKCAACGKILRPQEDDLCDSCQKEELRQQMEDPNYFNDYDQYYADLAREEERRGWDGL